MPNYIATSSNAYFAGFQQASNAVILADNALDPVAYQEIVQREYNARSRRFERVTLTRPARKPLPTVRAPVDLDSFSVAVPMAPPKIAVEL